MNEVRAGVAGGTLFSLLPLVTAEELCRTMLLACIGAGVSFAVTYILKRIVSRRKD